MDELLTWVQDGESGHEWHDKDCACLQEVPSPVAMSFNCKLFAWEKRTVAEQYQQCVFKPSPAPPRPASPSSPPLTCLTEPVAINVSASMVLHNNLGGLGPDAGAPNLRYGTVGVVNGRPFDLLVEVVGDHGYTSPNGHRANGASGAFGQVDVGYGSRTKLRFSFLWPDSMDEVSLQQVRWNIYDVASGDREFAHCKEMVMVDKARPFSYQLAAEPALRVQQNGTQTWFMSNRTGDKLQNPASPLDLTKEQAASSVALVFDDVSSFELGLAFARPNYGTPFTIDTAPCYRRSGGRTILFEGSALPACPPAPPPPAQHRKGSNLRGSIGLLAEQTVETMAAPPPPPQPPVPGLVRALRVDRYQTTRAAVHLSAPGASASWLVEQLRAACLAEPCDVSILKRQ